MKILILVLVVFGFITVSTVKTSPLASDATNQKYKECINGFNARHSSRNKVDKMYKYPQLSKECPSDLYTFK